MDNETLALLDRLDAIAANTSGYLGPWDGLSIDEDGYVYVPQCSHMGDSLISLDDTYEQSGPDCYFIQELLTAYPTLAAALRAQIARADEAEANLATIKKPLIGDMNPMNREWRDQLVYALREYAKEVMVYQAVPMKIAADELVRCGNRIAELESQVDALMAERERLVETATRLQKQACTVNVEPMGEAVSPHARKVACQRINSADVPTLAEVEAAMAREAPRTP